MLGSKLWHNKTETETVKVAKMVEFIKTYQNSAPLSSLFSAGEKEIFKKALFGVSGYFPSAWSGHDKNLGASFAWGSIFQILKLIKNTKNIFNF